MKDEKNLNKKGAQNEQPVSSKEDDRISKPQNFPQGKIGSGFMATVAGQPSIRDTADEEESGNS